MAFGPDPPKLQVHLCVSNGTAAIAFYERAFGATCTMKQLAPDGVRVLHANLVLFGSEVMLQDAFPEWSPDVLPPDARGGASMTISINLPQPGDVDAALQRAGTAGAWVTLAAADMFWGARYGRLRDPSGHVWAFNAPLGLKKDGSTT